MVKLTHMKIIKVKTREGTVRISDSLTKPDKKGNAWQTKRIIDKVLHVKVSNFMDFNNEFRDTHIHSR